MGDDKPLVVNLDGTLIRTRLLHEALISLLVCRPWCLPGLVLVLVSGWAAFKAAVAQLVGEHGALPCLQALPMNEAVLALVRGAGAQGREIYLASDSDRHHVEAVAAHVGGFNGVFASGDGVDFTRVERVRSLVAHFGEGGFDYVGSTAVDLPVWAVARTAYVAAKENATAWTAKLHAIGRGVWIIDVPRSGGGAYLRALRPHQWLKNILLLVPGLAAHVTEPRAYAVAILAFVSFSLCSSSVYLLNDLADIANDREHVTKRFRPLAFGSVPLSHGLGLFAILLWVSAGLAWLVSPTFCGVLVGYFLCTLIYSFWLKRLLVLDVVMLACLYGLRVVAGGGVFGVPLSDWLIAFSFFWFFCLALVKRSAELSLRLRAGDSDPPGRAYRLGDLPILEALSAASGFAAIVVLTLYVTSPMVTQLYAFPGAIWEIGLVLAYWLCRLLILTHRGEIDDDPVAFAATDRVSLVCGAMVVALVVGGSVR